MPEPLAVELENDEVKPKVDEKPKEEAKKAEEPQYVKVDDLKKISQQLNGISSALRTSEKEKKELSKKLEDLEDRLSGKQIKPKEAQDELDKMLEQGEWRTPVKKVTEATVDEILNRREAERQSREQESERLRVLEASKKKVREKYPDIDDPQSETAKGYMKVLNSNPSYLRSEIGPLLAMRDMEDEMDENHKEGSDKEAARRARASATSLRPGTPARTETITLTKEQKEFCKASGLNETAYLNTLKSMNNRSVEVE